ncbi:MAG: type II toxin-antitoxin system VapC family toxin [Chloroflexi bacterium]|nr:type II toxin-antitoxin system VapC family toxin [Chloroflexota bacterium]
MVVLDTDIVIDFWRGYAPASAWLATLQTEEIVLPGFVAMELIQGCKSKSDQEKVVRLLEMFNLIWLEPEECDKALTLFKEFHLSQGLDLLDALIGQTALSLKQSLHTFNRKHYAAIPELLLVQPYKK